MAAIGSAVDACIIQSAELARCETRSKIAGTVFQGRHIHPGATWNMVRRDCVPLLRSRYYLRISSVIRKCNLRMCQLAQSSFADKFSEYKAMTRKDFEVKPDA